MKNTMTARLIIEITGNEITKDLGDLVLERKEVYGGIKTRRELDLLFERLSEDVMMTFPETAQETPVTPLYQDQHA